MTDHSHMNFHHVGGTNAWTLHRWRDAGVQCWTRQGSFTCVCVEAFVSGGERLFVAMHLSCACTRSYADAALSFNGGWYLSPTR